MYLSFVEFRSKRSIAQLETLAENFLASRSLKELAVWFQIAPHKLSLLASRPQYETFFIPKKNGGKRQIQHPSKPIKSLQRKLATALQAVYYPERSPAAYGFLLCPADDDQPRNIYTNACQHVGQPWLINVDLKDFFHQIRRKRLEQLFQQAPFAFTPKAATVLARLCTCDGRLPMGAPTSPILSNLVCRQLDAELLALASARNYVYTRYADDLSFSSRKKIKGPQVAELRQCIEQHGFRLNEKKLLLQAGDQSPEVTGLILGKEKPDVSKAFLKGIKYDLKVLEALNSPRMMERDIFRHRPVGKLQQSIQGQLNFVKFVRGPDHKSVQKLEDRLRGLGG